MNKYTAASTQIYREAQRDGSISDQLLFHTLSCWQQQFFRLKTLETQRGDVKIICIFYLFSIKLLIAFT